MRGGVAVLGGSGFVGRFLMERWPYREQPPPRFLIHRSRPEWLQELRADVRLIELTDARALRAALDGTSCLINLLRPDGSGWLKELMHQLVPMLAQISIARLVHASSIDVYGGTHASYVTEETLPQPRTPYQQEHLETEKIVERAPYDTIIVRPGAIFGSGGRNVASFVPEIRNAPSWKLVARRALYGQRRMHLVSVENVADVIRTLSVSDSPASVRRILVTDDDAPENNFAFLQDTMAAVFGRPELSWVPEMPELALRTAMIARRGTSANPMRRFSRDKLVEIGFRPEESFATRLLRYVTSLRDTGGLHSV